MAIARRPSLVTCAVVAVAAGGISEPLATTSAGAADAVVDAGPIARPILAGVESHPVVGAGRGWLIWGHRDEDGRVTLMASRAGSAPRRLAVERLEQLRWIDVGRGTRGSAAAIYGACRRRVCRVFRLELSNGRETRLDVRAPPGCRRGETVIDSNVYFVALARTARCRSGIYELRGRRPVLRQATPSGGAYGLDVDNGDLAFARWDARDPVHLEVRLRGTARPREISRRVFGSWKLTWDAGALWMGWEENAGAEGHGAGAIRVTFHPAARCLYEQRGFSDHTSDPPLGGWAFTDGRLYYTLPDADGRFSLRQRTDPAPAYRRYPC